MEKTTTFGNPNRIYTSPNNIKLYKCTHLNWAIHKKYWEFSGIENNPDYYIINIGSLSNMWQAILTPETMLLSFTNCSYSSNEVYRFKVENIEEATDIVYKFIIGMNQLENMEGTIYYNK